MSEYKTRFREDGTILRDRGDAYEDPREIKPGGSHWDDWRGLGIEGEKGLSVQISELLRWTQMAMQDMDTLAELFDTEHGETYCHFQTVYGRLDRLGERLTTLETQLKAALSGVPKVEYELAREEIAKEFWYEQATTRLKEIEAVKERITALEQRKLFQIEFNSKTFARSLEQEDRLTALEEKLESLSQPPAIQYVTGDLKVQPVLAQEMAAAYEAFRDAGACDHMAYDLVISWLEERRKS